MQEEINNKITKMEKPTESKTAEEIYFSNDEEFCKGDPNSLLNKACSTHRELVHYSMEEYADLKVREFKERLLNELPSDERINEISQKYKEPISVLLGMTKLKVMITDKLK